MTDIRDEDRIPLDGDEDRLPWLEAVEEDGENDGPSPLKLIASVIIGLIAIGLIVGGLFWMGSRDGEATRDAELIAAPEGDYKVKPGDPGGMTVEGKGDTSYAASAGEDPKGAINTNAITEAPVTPAPKGTPPAKAGPAATPTPAPAAAASGPSIQLGAFSSQAGANNAWKAMSARFAYLAPLTHSVSPTQSGGRTLYRLRASGPGAEGLCGRLRVAGETCVSVN